jgi:hypothetical protein
MMKNEDNDFTLSNGKDIALIWRTLKVADPDAVRK